MSEEKDETTTFKTKEFEQFLEQLQTNIADITNEAAKNVFDASFTVIADRMDKIAHAQIVLAQALKSNRRDKNAREFAKLFIKRSLEAKEADAAMGPEAIAALAYAIANEMEIHSQVATIQADSREAAVAEHVQKNPRADSKTLADSFLGRNSKPPKKTKGH